MRNEYDAFYVCMKSVHFTQATRSAFDYERPAFAYCDPKGKLLVTMRMVNTKLFKPYLSVCVCT